MLLPAAQVKRIWFEITDTHFVYKRPHPLRVHLPIDTFVIILYISSYFIYFLITFESYQKTNIGRCIEKGCASVGLNIDTPRGNVKFFCFFFFNPPYLWAVHDRMQLPVRRTTTGNGRGEFYRMAIDGSYWIVSRNR